MTKIGENSRKLGEDAARVSRESAENNPLLVVAGGLALGALLGALLPGTERERRVVGKTGRDLNLRAKQAFGAARDAGSDQLKKLGENKDIVKNQLQEMVSKGSEAAKAAAIAAKDAAKDGGKPGQSAGTKATPAGA